jgi:hypothetical protein
MLTFAVSPLSVPVELVLPRSIMAITNIKNVDPVNSREKLDVT